MDAHLGEQNEAHSSAKQTDRIAEPGDEGWAQFHLVLQEVGEETSQCLDQKERDIR